MLLRLVSRHGLIWSVTYKIVMEDLQIDHNKSRSVPLENSTRAVFND